MNHLDHYRSGAIRTLLMGLFAVAMATGTAIPSSAQGTWTNTGSLNTARRFHSATLLMNGDVLVAGGRDSAGNTLTSAELYNPATGRWTVTGSLATARYIHSATLLSNGEVLVAGGIFGIDIHGVITCDATAELYNPTTGQWTTTGSMSKSHCYHTATLLTDGTVLVAGGGTISSPDNSAEIYDPSKGTWKATGSMNVARAVTAATLLPNGQVLISGGNSTSAGGRSAELYTNGHWNLTTSMNVLRQSLTATLLTNGDVLVFGGSNLESDATEFYNPTPATWSRTHCFCVSPPIGGQTETLLPNRKVLIAGGLNEYHFFFGARLYDSSTNSWSATGNMKTFRSGHTATLLQNGLVLAAGGSSSTGVTASAELYAP
jgi:N-acetylneuraminic acid mutarotase